MANGFEVNITEKEFKARPIADQQWILFQGITSLNRDGCVWGVNRYKGEVLKKWTALGVGLSGGLGFIYILYQLVNR